MFYTDDYQDMIFYLLKFLRLLIDKEGKEKVLVSDHLMLVDVTFLP